MLHSHHKNIHISIEMSYYHTNNKADTENNNNEWMEWLQIQRSRLSNSCKEYAIQAEDTFLEEQQHEFRTDLQTSFESSGFAVNMNEIFMQLSSLQSASETNHADTMHELSDLKMKILNLLQRLG